MPISKHYGGHGEEVMRSMRKQYGPKAERIFYATENKQKNEDSAVKKSMKRAMK